MALDGRATTGHSDASSPRRFRPGASTPKPTSSGQEYRHSRGDGRMKIASVRVIQADIPVARPHKMSFTVLEAVNFAFVRLETVDGLVGWGEAACLGGPTWSEESSESVAALIERYIAPWLVGREASGIELVAREMARRVQGNPFARAAVEMALWDLNGRATGVGGRGADPAAAGGARARHFPSRGRQSGLGSADCAQGHPRPHPVWHRLRGAAPTTVGPRGHGGDRPPGGRAPHGRRVVLLAPGRPR